MVDDRDDINDVIKEESARGRRHVDTDEERRARKRRSEMLKAITTRDERRFLTYLRESGVKDGTPEFAAALRKFRELCRS